MASTSERTQPPKITLPSGRLVIIKARPDRLRPWYSEAIGYGFHVVRRERRGDSAELNSYTGGTLKALIFSEADAQCVVEELNKRNLPDKSVV